MQELDSKLKGIIPSEVAVCVSHTNINSTDSVDLGWGCMVGYRWRWGKLGEVGKTS